MEADISQRVGADWGHANEYCETKGREGEGLQNTQQRE